MSSEDPKSPSHAGSPDDIDPEEFDALQFLLDDPTDEIDANNSPQETLPQTSSANEGSSNPINPAESSQHVLANPSKSSPQQNAATEKSPGDGDSDYSLSYIINGWMDSRRKSSPSSNPIIGENSNISVGSSPVEAGGGQLSRNEGPSVPPVTKNPPRKPAKFMGKLPELAPGLSWYKETKRKQITHGTGKPPSSPSSRKKKTDISGCLRGVSRFSRYTTASKHGNLSTMNMKTSKTCPSNPAETSGKGKGICDLQQRSSFSRSQHDRNFHANPNNLEMLLDQEFQRLQQRFGDSEKLPPAQQPSLKTRDPENQVSNQIPISLSPESLDIRLSHGNSFALEHDPKTATQGTGQTSLNIPTSTSLPLDSVTSVGAEAPVDIERSNNTAAAETVATETGDIVPILEDQKEETETGQKEEYDYVKWMQQQTTDFDSDMDLE